MCAGNVGVTEVTGSAKGAQGWFPIQRASVVHDHPFHAQMDEALIIDFANPNRGPGARLSVELSTESARSLVQLIETALSTRERPPLPSP